MKRDDEWLRKYEDSLKNKFVLELGAGEGRDSNYLQSVCSNVVVTDKNISNNHVKNRVEIDHSKSLPFSSNRFEVILASLCLHYFSFEVSRTIVDELKRVMAQSGTLICRLNSVHDVNYGAGKGKPIEPGFYEINGRTKRFFTKEDVEKLFSGFFKISSCEHKVIDRYMHPKSVFEIVAVNLYP